jgi:oligopeptide transport system substrate-binding protein
MAGELHFTSDIPTDQIAFLKEKLGAQVHIAPYLGTLFLIVRSSKPPFNDVRVRQALAMVIDREFLAAEIWGGTMLPAYGMIPPGVNNYRAPAQAPFAAKSPIEREDEAKRLLAAAGFGPSKPLKIELRYNMTDNNKRTMVAIADQWKQIGVETTFITTDGKTHFAYLRDGGEFDVARYGWIADYSDPQNFLFLLESDNTGFNSGRYHNPEYDRLMRQAEGETDLKKRAEILFSAESIFVRDMPWIPLLFYSTKNLVSSKLKGFQPNTRGAYATRFLRLEP